MDPETVYTFCMSMPEAEETFPFDEKTLVFKVRGKMFAATDADTFEYINLKCRPDKAIELREMHAWIQPGYHMNKQHWNSVMLNEETDPELLRTMIRDSWRLVVENLPKKQSTELLARLD